MTPVNWKSGDDVIISPEVSNEDARATFPQGFRAVKDYLRFIAQPG